MFTIPHDNAYIAHLMGLTRCFLVCGMQILAEYTREGLRVIALAKADVPSGNLPASAISSYTQQQLEQAVGLDLVGLAVLENPLRNDTTGVIEILQKAQVGLGSLCCNEFPCWDCHGLHVPGLLVQVHAFASG